MPYVMVDIEADGPIPGDYSMIAIGAIVVEPSLHREFSAHIRPISEKWLPEALAVSGFTREQTMDFVEPKHAMEQFAEWLGQLKSQPVFVSDNNGFDWQFVCWYFHHFTGKNPFGFSSQNLGSLYKGLVKDTSKNFKHLRKTHHSHDPVDDALGNAEAFLTLIKEHSLRTRL